MITKNIVILVTLLLTVQGELGQYHKNALSEEILGRQIKGVNLNNTTITNALAGMLSAAHTPGGVVSIASCDADANYTLIPAGTTLRHALDSISNANPQY